MLICVEQNTISFSASSIIVLFLTAPHLHQDDFSVSGYGQYILIQTSRQTNDLGRKVSNISLSISLRHLFWVLKKRLIDTALLLIHSIIYFWLRVRLCTLIWGPNYLISTLNRPQLQMGRNSILMSRPTRPRQHSLIPLPGGGGNLIFSYIRRLGSFFWFKIFNFNIFF